LVRPAGRGVDATAAHALDDRGIGNVDLEDVVELDAGIAQRVDDEEETVKKRLAVYASQTRPLVEYYARWAASGDPAAPIYRKISGTGEVEEITARALAALT
jgi:adenylate kinase family enzyme